VAFGGVLVFLHPVPLFFGWLGYLLPVLCCCGFGGFVGWLVWSCSCYGLVIGWGGSLALLYRWDS